LADIVLFTAVALVIICNETNTRWCTLRA